MLDMRGGSVVKYWDSRGMYQGIANELGYRQTYVYDAVGNLTTMTGFAENVVSQTFDAVNRVTKKQYVVDGTSASWRYDAVGNVISAVAPSTLTTTYAYDGANRLTSRTDPGALVVAYRYYANGKVFVLTNPEAGRYTYAYDREVQQILVVGPDGNTTNRQMDFVGRELTYFDTSTDRTTNTYDAVGQITNILTAKGATISERFTYTYDALGNRVSCIDLNGSSTAWSYDAKDRLIEEKTAGTNAHDYTYTYDSNDKRLTSTETGSMTQYAYDAANRLVTAVSGGLTTTYGYSQDGTLSSVVEPTVTYAFTQDGGYRLASQTATPGGTKNWTYDANGRLASYAGPSPTGTTTVVWDGDDYLELKS